MSHLRHLESDIHFIDFNWLDFQTSESHNNHKLKVKWSHLKSKRREEKNPFSKRDWCRQFRKRTSHITQFIVIFKSKYKHKHKTKIDFIKKASIHLIFNSMDYPNCDMDLWVLTLDCFCMDEMWINKNANFKCHRHRTLMNSHVYWQYARTSLLSIWKCICMFKTICILVFVSKHSSIFINR